MPAMQTLVVMRHAKRLDEVDPTFASTSESWWDPPLTPEGHQQVLDACRVLSGMALRVLVVSPFLRCLQTAAIVKQAMDGSFDQTHVDCKLCEMLTPRNLNMLDREVPAGLIQDWMWQGATAADALLRKFPAANLSVDDADLPKYPETPEQAHARASKALEDIANRYEGQNILVISHGEVIHRSVTRILPWVTVVDAKHCCFTVATRQQDADGDWEPWKLDTSETHEVKMLGL